jgi:hypothetical protein
MMKSLKFFAVAGLVLGSLAFSLSGCDDDFDDADGAVVESSQSEESQEAKDDRAQKAANDAIDNTGGMNVNYGD